MNGANIFKTAQEFLNSVVDIPDYNMEWDIPLIQSFEELKKVGTKHKIEIHVTATNEKNIVVDGNFIFHFMSYSGKWGFYPIVTTANPPMIGVELIPDRELFEIPGVLKSWNEEKFESVITFLTQWKENIETWNKSYNIEISVTKEMKEELQKIQGLKGVIVDDENTIKVHTKNAEIKILANGLISINRFRFSCPNAKKTQGKHKAIIEAVLAFEKTLAEID